MGDLAGISSVITTLLQDNIVAQVNRQTPSLAFLERKKGLGAVCTWPVRGSGAKAAPYAETADFSSPTSDERLKATLDWGKYKSEFQVTGIAEAAALASGNPAQLANLLRDEIKNAAESLGDAIGWDFYNGAEAGDPEEIVGVVEAFDDGLNTATYAGITRLGGGAPKTFFQGNRVHFSGVAWPGGFTQQLMRQTRTKISRASGANMPDYLIFGSPEVIDEYAAIFDAQRDYVTEVTLPGRGQITLDGGYEVVKFGNALMIPDKYAPIVNDVAGPDRGKLFWINPRYVYWRILPSAPNALGLFGQEDIAAATPGAQMFPATVQILGPKGDKTHGFIKMYIQLVVERPNACGILEDISVGEVTEATDPTV